MGSENNMVAVECQRDMERIRQSVERQLGDNYDRVILSPEDWDVVQARLASPQPDAQQGEGCRVVQHRTLPRPLAKCTLVERLTVAAVNIDNARNNGTTGFLAGWEQQAIREAAQAIADAATPSSPALDAATIERCARVADAARNAPTLEGMMPSGIAAAIRALPNAEKRHG